MKIPKNIKIGGDVFAVNITEHLALGEGYAGEVLHEKCEINIRPGVRSRMEGTLIHEILHSLLEHLGYHDQEEKMVDEMGHALYALIADNPGLFEGDEDATVQQLPV
jgi:hypothetical protein